MCVLAGRYRCFVGIDCLFLWKYLVNYSWFKWHIKLSNMTYHGLISIGLRTGRPRLRFLFSQFNPLKPSGHYMYHQFNIHNSTFCPHTVFMCFVWIWEQTAIISLYSINWLVCITETQCVYCAVRTGSLNTVCVNLWFKPGFDLWSVRVRFMFNKVSLGQVFLQIFTFLAVSTIPFHSTPPFLHSYLRLSVARTRRTDWLSLWTFRNAVLFRNSGRFWYKNTCTCI